MRVKQIIQEYGDIIKTSYNLTKINSELKNKPKNIVSLSEKLYLEQLYEVVDDIAESKGEYKILLIAGPSSSGKTTTSHLIRKLLSKVGINSVVVSMDDFFINRNDVPFLENGTRDYENVEAVDINCFNTFVTDIINKNVAKMPHYDFITGERTQEWSEVVTDTNTIVLIEGIHALNPILIPKNNDRCYRLYVCLNSNFDIEDRTAIPARKLRLMRRLLRDYYTRGHSISSTFIMWENVLAGEEKYIKPYKSTANYLIDTTHLYEPMLYKKYLLPLLQEAPPSPKVNEMIKYFENVEELDKKYIPNDSVLWEFVKK